MKRRVIALTTLLIAVVAATYIFQEWFCHPGNFFDEDRLTFFHNEPENSMDIVLMGSSDVYSGFTSGYAYEQFGISSYPYAISGATIVSWKGMLEDILEYQNPEYVIVEPFGACYDNSVVRERTSQSIKLLDTMPLSVRKYRLAKDISSRVEGTKTIDFMFPFIKYHNYYGGYVRNFKKHLAIKGMGTSPLKGVSNVTRISQPAVVYDATKDTRTLELDSDSQELLIEFLEYAKSKNVKLIFVRFPQVFAMEGEDQHRSLLRANRLGEIVEEYGYPYINLQQKWNELGLDAYHDFYNRAHLNVYGQKKLTAYLCNYLINEQGLKLRNKGAELQQHWNEAGRYYGGYTGLSEELIAKGEVRELGDAPEIVEEIGRYMGDRK